MSQGNMKHPQEVGKNKKKKKKKKNTKEGKEREGESKGAGVCQAGGVQLGWDGGTNARGDSKEVGIYRTILQGRGKIMRAPSE